MGALSIRNLDDHVKERLRALDAAHGRSMESEVRAILVDAVSRPDGSGGLFIALLQQFGDLGGVDLDLPRRSTPVRAADLTS